jgi:hypothetical protein
VFAGIWFKYNQGLQGILVTPEYLVINNPMQTFTFNVTAYYSDNHSETVTAATAWRMSDPRWTIEPNGTLHINNAPVEGWLRASYNGAWRAIHVWVDSTIDTDGDGLSDIDESRIGTNPSAIDTDGDGISDNNDYYPLAINNVSPPLVKMIYPY